MSQTIIHICGDCKGGTEKYVNDLIQLYPSPQYNHIIERNIPFVINNIDSIYLVHIHCVFFESNIGWNILSIIEQFKNASKNILFYLTIHDYQWLFDCNILYPLKTIDDRYLCKEYYSKNNSEKLQQLFNTIDRIFIPSQRVFEIYKYFMDKDLTLKYINKMHIIQHCDIYTRLEQLYIPYISNNIINIAFIGTFNEYKGGPIFLELIYNLRNYKDYIIHYHIFGKHTQSEHDNKLLDYVHFHGSYKNNKLIEQLYANNIHIITSLSVFEETYCYALSLLINSGLPIVYLNRGALLTRLCDKYSRMFPFTESSFCIIKDTIIKTIEYIELNQGRKDLIDISNNVILNEEYNNLYLPKQ